MMPGAIFGLWTVLGAAAAAALLWWIGRKSLSGQRRLLSQGLLLAALIYVCFALLGTQLTDRWLAVEVVGMVIYGALAWLGRRSTPWLAVGWLLHVLWDLLLHDGMTAPGVTSGLGLGPSHFVPTWYPPACLGFDVAVAVYLLWRWRRGEASL